VPAVALLWPVLLGGCPDPAPGRWADRWEEYRSPDYGEHPPPRGSPTDRRAWDVPENVRPLRWRYIVLHHSATDEGSAAVFDRYHREVKRWKGLAYHFVIGNGTLTPDGAVEVGYRWGSQTPGAHAGVREYNYYGIGVCLVGDFERSTPTAKQAESLGELLGFLMARFDVPPSGVVRHGDVANTKCPGKNFPWPVPLPAKDLDGVGREKRKRPEGY
jgi:N-acetyl-anhydromuramyl-L-alanine amidase AmpD